VQRNLEVQIAQAKTDLSDAAEEAKQQQSTLNELKRQAQATPTDRDNTIQALNVANANLEKVRDEVVRQARSILFQQAAFVAAQIYDARFYEEIYKEPHVGLVFARTKPLLSDGGKCFDKFFQANEFTWWNLIQCEAESETFLWPIDATEKQHVDRALVDSSAKRSRGATSS
jgi:hypothetical protein